MDGSVYHFYLLISSKHTYSCCKNILCFVLDGYSVGLAEKVL